MAERRYPDRFRLNLRDPASFDIHWKRDQTLTFQLTAWDTSGVGDFITGLTGVGALTATVRELPNVGPLPLLQRPCTGGGGHEGLFDLALLADDFPDLAFDLGQPFLCLWLDLLVEASINGDAKTIPVFDGAGHAIFPLRVHQTMGVGA
jgi:hypothetical protein